MKKAYVIPAVAFLLALCSCSAKKQTLETARDDRDSIRVVQRSDTLLALRTYLRHCEIESDSVVVCIGGKPEVKVYGVRAAERTASVTSVKAGMVEDDSLHSSISARKELKEETIGRKSLMDYMYYGFAMLVALYFAIKAIVLALRKS